jgi:hypothetical protein
MKITTCAMFSVFGLLVIAISNSGSAGLIAGVDFEGASDNIYDENPDDLAASDGVTVSTGGGTGLYNGWTIVKTSDGTSAGGFRNDGGATGAGGTSPDFPSRLEGGRVASFAITIDDSTALDLDRIVFDVRGGTNGTGRDVQFRTSLEGETEYLYENLNLPGRTTGGWTNVDLTLSDSKYDGLTGRTIDIVFRTPGGAIDLDTIEVYGTTSPTPEPSTLALAALGLLGLIGCGRRRKR